MKVVNIVLSVLVLLAAIVSAVFSYFLYEKRVAFVNGWNQLAGAIYENARTLDRNSGTNAAKELTADKLSHTVYTEGGMKKSLANMLNQGKNMLAQRDYMAETLQNVGRTVSAGTGSASDFKAIASSKEQSDKVKRAVSDTVSNRNRVYRELSDVIYVDSSKLNRGDVSALKPVKDMKNARNQYKSALSSIASRVGVSSPGSDTNAARDSRAVVSAVVDKLNSVTKIRIELDRAGRTIYEQKNTIASKDKVISSRDAVIAEKERQINELKRALGIAPESNFALWNKEDARLHATGKVTKVSKDYGYIVIDLGTSSVAYQQAGKKMIDINLGLESGVEFFVVRGAENELVAVVSLDKVGEKESTANIPVDKIDKIKTGDKIIYKPAK